MTECRVLLKDIKKDKTISIVNNSALLAPSPKTNKTNRKYTCYVCWRVFAFKHELTTHKLTHIQKDKKKINNKEKTVDNTHKTSNNNNSSKKIVKNDVEKIDLSKPAPFNCLFCNVDFQSVEEVKMHPRNALCRYNCKECDKNFNTVHGFLIHLLQHKINFTKGHDDKYSCSQCSEMFQDIIQLKSHNLLVHTVTTRVSEPTQDEPEQNVTPMEEEKEPDFTCELCYDMFSSVEELNDHMDFHKQLNGITNDLALAETDNANEEMNSTQNGDNLTSETETDSASTEVEYDVLEPDNDIPQIRYKCKKCERTFMNLYDFNQHKADKCNLINQCVECNESVVSNGDYYQHFLEKHSDVYICPYCFESLIGTKNIEDHKLEHLKSFKNVCKICFIIFPTHQIFNKHLLEDHLQ